MVEKIVEHVVGELNHYFGLHSPMSESVIADSFFGLDGAVNSNIREKLFAQLVNIEQDKTYHSLDVYKKNDEGVHHKIHPPLKINIYILFIASFSDYSEALKAISRTVGFFQKNNAFQIDNGNQKVVAEMISMSFEQQNHIWGMLGGKYMPSAMYKIGIIDFQDSSVEAELPVVKEIRINR